MSNSSLSNLSTPLPAEYAFGEPQVSGKLKQQLADFQVEEVLPFSFSGEGEHLWLFVEKHGENTDWVAKHFSGKLGVAQRNIGNAGLKDRQAITRQWFSIQLPGQADPDLSELETDSIKILQATRHSRKLQKGALEGNKFTLVLRDLQGDLEGLENRLNLLATRGFPNYFMEQRFGRDNGNLAKALDFFAGEGRKPRPNQRSLYISAARSFLFNQVLAERIKQQSWDKFIAGDVVQLDGSTRWFADDGSDNLAKRVAEQDLHPTAPMVGDGKLDSQGEVLELEEKVLELYPELVQGLIAQRLKQDRRSLRQLAKDLSWNWLDAITLEIKFFLPAGSYATALVKELIKPV